MSRILALIVFIAGVTSAAADPDRWRSEWSKTDFDQHSVPYSEIISTLVRKDGIPPIDDPKFMSVSEITGIGAQEPVIGLEVNGIARAYPLGILTWHEIVNDRFGDVPVTITYCPLCNSAVVFDRRLNGQVLDFGVTGKLRNSDMVMYDRQTESWWQQFLGEAIVGEMTGARLKTVPARLEAFEVFKARHPEGDVLIPNRAGMRRYGQNPYEGYDNNSAPPYGLFVGNLPDYIEPMARVIAFERDGGPYAVALELMRDRTRLELGDVVITWTAGQNSALDTRMINEGRDVGNIVVQRKTEDGLEDMVYDVTFAFVFNAFHPDLRIQQE